MQGFADRRPAQAVPPATLRSRAALEEHLASHHGGYGRGTDRSHSELREFHAENHTDQFAIIHVPHLH